MSNPFDQFDTVADKTADRISRLEGSGDSAVSPKGARGRYQITRATADAYGINYDRLDDPDYARRSAERILTDLGNKFGDDEQAIEVAYNAGPARAKSWIAGGRKIDSLPVETQEYLAHSHSLDGGNPFDLWDAPKPADRPKLESSPVARTPLRKVEGFGKAPTLSIGQEAGRDVAEALQAPARRLAEDARRSPGIDLPFRLGADVLGEGQAVVEGLGEGLVGRPLNELVRGVTGRRGPETAGEAATRRRMGEQVATAAAFAGAPEAEVAGGVNMARLAREGIVPTARRAVRAAAEPALEDTAAVRKARVGRLEEAGVYVPEARRSGGQIQRVYEAFKTHPLTSATFRQLDEQSIESFNKAGYDKALAPLGERFPRRIPAGRDAIAYIQQQFDKAYGAILPQVRVEADNPMVESLADIQRQARTLGPNQAAFEEIIKQNVISHFSKDAVIDGRTFKDIESQLTFEAREFKRSPNPFDKKTGRLIDEVTDVLRDGAERSSAPGVRARLRAVNTGYAVFSRVADASTNRATSLGVFTPADLAGAVKKADRAVRKTAYRRGDALLQDFADDGVAVLTNVLPGTGTAEQLNLTSKKGIIEGTLSPFTNTAAKAIIRRREAARLGRPGRPMPRAFLPRILLAPRDQQQQP